MTNIDKGYILPEGDFSADDVELVCHRVWVPNRPEFVRAFWGGLDYYGTWVAWQRDELKRGVVAARLWKLANDITNQHWGTPCNQPLPDEEIDLQCECEGEDCMCNFVFNVYCDGVANGLPDNGDGDGNGDGGPPLPPPTEGFVYLQPDGILVEGLAEPVGLTIDTETVPLSWWIYGSDFEPAANLTFELLAPTYPGTFVGVMLFVATWLVPEQGNAVIRVGGWGDENNFPDSPLPLRLVGSNANSAIWDGIAAGLVDEEGYQNLTGINTAAVDGVVRGDLNNFPGDVNVILSPWYVFAAAFG